MEEGEEMNPETTIRSVQGQRSFVSTLIYNLLHSKNVKSLPLLTNAGSHSRPVSKGNYITGMRRKARTSGRKSFKVYGKTRHI